MAFSCQPWIPGALKLDSILSLFKFALPNQNGLQNALSLNEEKKSCKRFGPLTTNGGNCQTYKCYFVFQMAPNSNGFTSSGSCGDDSILRSPSPPPEGGGGGMGERGSREPTSGASDHHHPKSVRSGNACMIKYFLCLVMVRQGSFSLLLLHFFIK